MRVLPKADSVFYGEDCFYCLNKRYGAYILTLYPAGEALEQVNDTIVFIVLIEVLVFAVLFIVLHLLIKSILRRP